MKPQEQQEIDRFHDSVRETRARGVLCGTLIALALSLPPGPSDESIDLDDESPFSEPHKEPSHEQCHP